MKHLFSVIILSIIYSVNIYSQDLYELKQAFDFFNSFKQTEGGWKTALSEVDIEGSPYLNDEFIEGSIFTTSKNQFVNVPVRYNIFNDEIEFRTDDGIIQAIALPETIEKIEFGDYKMEYIPYLLGGRIKRGFFVVLEKGNATLYARPQILFEPAKEPGAYSDAQPPKFIKSSDEYYIRVGMEPAKIIIKRRDISNVLPDHQEQLEDYIKEHKIKTNRPDDLGKLVQYYNSL
jgi:hypothetical protein